MKTATPVLFWALGGLAQTAGQSPTFEAATIKIDTSFTPETGEFEHGRVILHGGTLRHLVGAAYETAVYLVQGGPKWADTTRFDVSAKGDEKGSEADSRLMLRALLAERFHLRVHREDQMEKVYLLQVGRRGAKLRESAANSSLPSGCISSFGLTCRKATMATLARALRAHATGIDVPVVDETGIDGTYDFALSFVVGADNGPTVFDALQDQLGLKLQASRRPIKVLVIDGAEPLIAAR